MRIACDRGAELNFSCNDEICLEKYGIQKWYSTFCSASKSEEEKVRLKTAVFSWNTFFVVLRHPILLISISY